MAERQLVSRRFPKGAESLMTKRIDTYERGSIREERRYYRLGGVGFYYFDRRSGRPLSGEEVRARNRRSR